MRYLAEHPDIARIGRACNRANWRAKRHGQSDRLTWADVREVLSRPCVGCGATDGITIDHVIPTAKGGPNRLSNLQALCGPCNIKKGDK